jgi:glycosyltransferase involved in cell wall biosynthesis
VSFLVPVRNDAEGLRRCLTSIRSQRPDVQLIVADNGSVDASRDVARAFGATVVELPGHPVAVLRNRAAAAASGEFLGFVDADIQLPDGWLDSALQAFSDARVGAVGSEYVAPPRANWLQRLYDAMREHPRGQSETRWLPAGNLVVRRAAFNHVGGFDESLTTCEDVAFCNSLKKSGHRVIADARLRSAHFGDPSTLRALFRGELWRGRDNLRVSVQGISSWKDLPSIVIPIVWLAAAGVAIASIVAATTWQPTLGWLALGALALLAVQSMLRAIRIWLRIRREVPGMFGRACALAIVYDSARALALLISVPHRRAEVRPTPVGEQA